MEKIFKKALSSLLIVTVAILPFISAFSLRASASSGSEPLVDRVAQYCMDTDILLQLKGLDLSNIDNYNKYVEIFNLYNKSKKEAHDLFYLAGDDEFNADYGFASHTLREAMADNLILRGSLGLSGLIFNDELIGYAVGQDAGVEKYKAALQSFLEAQNDKLKLYGTIKSINSFLKSISVSIDTFNSSRIIIEIKQMIYEAKSVDDVKYALESKALEDLLNQLDQGEQVSVKSELTEVLGIAGDVLTYTNITANGIYNIAMVESTASVYKNNEDFLNGIINDKTLPSKLRVAARELYTDVETLRLGAAINFKQEIDKAVINKVISLSAKDMGSTGASAVIGDLILAFNVAKVLVGHVFSSKELVVGCSAIECYDILAEKYCKKVLKDKAAFNKNPTLENAESFREDYEYLQQLRLCGEKKFLQMIGFDKSWDPLQKTLMRTLTGYKENSAFLQGNVDSITAAEFSMKDDGETRNLHPKPFRDTTVSVQCPVNVFVYDKNDHLIASVENNEIVTEFDTADIPLVVYAEGEDKILRLSSENEYRIEIAAYDKGEMTYSVSKTDITDELVYETVYEDIKISKNDEFIVNSKENPDADLRELYSQEDAMEPTREYDNKKLPETKNDIADVVVAEELFEGYSKELIDKVAGAMFSMAPSVDIESYNIKTEDAVALFTAIAKYYPSEYSILSKSDFSYRIVFSPSRGCITLIRFYYGDDVNIDDYNRRVRETKEAIDKLVAKTKGMSDFEKILYVHDYLVLNCEYDLDLLEMLEANGTLSGSVYAERYTEYSVLVNGTGVCGSYALAYRAVLNACGIECLYLSSKKMNHAWNLVKLDGSWYHVDCCWDDPVPDNLGTARRTYFLRTDEEIMELNHYSWTPGENKAANTAYSQMPRLKYTVQKFDDRYWYTLESGTLFRSDRFGNNKQVVAQFTASSIDVENGNIYYSCGRFIFTLNKDGFIYYLPDSLSGTKKEYASVYSFIADGDDLTLYRGVSDGSEYVYYKNMQPDALDASNQVTSVTLSAASLNLGFNETKTLSCSFVQSGKTVNITPLWCSDNADVVSVSADGTVKSVYKGSATVYAVFGSLRLCCAVAVDYEGVKGTYGDNLIWEFSADTGTLTISGAGDMYNLITTGYFCGSTTPWQSYKSLIKNVIIESGVTSIGDYSFYECSNLLSVCLPFGITIIGDSAFRRCSKLTNILLPNSVKILDDSAFENSGLREITIPESVTDINYVAFYDCLELTNVTIPDSVTNIKKDAFHCCYNLERISVSQNNKIYDSRENCNAIIETKTNELFTGCKNTVIPKSVTSIGGDAFADCDGLTSIKIPDSVTSIGNHAFYNCTGLTSVTIPDSITHISSHVFLNCTGLTSVMIPDSVISIGEDAFCYCTGLTSITIPDSVTSIGDEAFYGCTGLTSVTIPNSVSSIGYLAFGECCGLTSATIPDSVTNFGAGAFWDCTGLTSVTIPDSVTNIGHGAFEYCTGLTKVLIKNPDVAFGNDVFNDCPSLTLYGHAGSTTEAYANRNNIPFVNIDAQPHTEHVYFLVAHTEKTKTADGMRRWQCYCGEKYTETDHNWGRTSTVQSTCTEPGARVTKCSVCGETKSQPIPATGHKFVLQSQNAIDLYHTEITWKCSVCGETKTETVETQAEHVYTYVTHEQTCTHQGYVEGICQLCDEHVIVSFTAPLGHEMKLTRIDSTCSEKATVTYCCERCGKIETATDENSVLKDHTPADTWTVVREATTEAEGLKEIRCTHCGKTLQSESIPKLTPPILSVQSVDVQDISLNYKSSSALKPDIKADPGTKYTVKYESDKPKVATVDKDGKVYAAGKGTANIKVTVTDSNGKTVTDTCKVTVGYTWWQWLIIFVLFGWIWY